jgi:hypothetical protein
MGWYLSSQNIQYDKQADHYAAEFAAHTDQEVLKSCGLTPGLDLIKCLRDELEAERDTKRSEADLAAQQKVAEWSLGAVILSALSLIFTAGGIWLVYLNLHEARKVTAQSIAATNTAVDANRIAHDAVFAEHRPWIGISLSEIAIYSDDGTNPVVVAKPLIKNYGGGLALGVQAHVSVGFTTFLVENSIAVERYAASITKPTTWRWGNTVIFPNIETEIYGISDDIQAPDNKRKSVRIIVCVTYRGVGSDKILHAARAFSCPSAYFYDLEGSGAEPKIEVTYIRGSDSVG